MKRIGTVGALVVVAFGLVIGSNELLDHTGAMGPVLNPLGVMIHSSIAGKVFVVLMASAVFVGVVDVVMWPWLKISDVVMGERCVEGRATSRLRSSGPWLLPCICRCRVFLCCWWD